MNKYQVVSLEEATKKNVFKYKLIKDDTVIECTMTNEAAWLWLLENAPAKIVLLG